METIALLIWQAFAAFVISTFGEPPSNAQNDSVATFSVTDKLISIGILLFILSMISERVVTFIKLWCTKGKRFLFIVVPAEVDTSTPSQDTATEAKRAKSILAINLTISFLIAFISKASMFDIFSLSTNDPALLLGWKWESDFTPYRLGSILVGSFLTACFISLGSKFWHDLLDLLLNVKDLKEKMVDRETYRVQTIKQLDEFIQTDYYNLASICLQQNKTKIQALPGFVDCFIGLSSAPGTRKPVITICSSLLGPDVRYPKAFAGTLTSGMPFTVAVEIVYGFATPEIHLDSGDHLCHATSAHRPGTAACMVKKKSTTYILTCAHVLTGGAAKVSGTDKNGWFTAPTNNDTLSENNGFDPIGTWSFGIINEELDIALIESTMVLDPLVNIKNLPPPYDLALNGEEVFVQGHVTKSKAFIAGYTEIGIDFQYSGVKHNLKNLILISKNKFSPITVTKGGDSGALVYLTKDNTALGIVVGGNPQYTYVIPMASVIKATQTKLS